MRQFSRRRSFAYSALIVAAFFGALEITARGLGVRTPARPRLILRAIDTDIDFPFMAPDPELFWAPRPGWTGEFLGHRVTINSLGLRGGVVAVPKPAGRRRVACFGDSITFGYGVSDEDTYAARLQVRLAEEGVDVVNAAVTGYTSHQVRRRLERMAPRLRPDVATFCIGWNDGTLRNLSDEGYGRRLRAAMAVEGLLDGSALFRAARGLYSRSALQPRERLVARVGPAEYRENLRDIVSYCRRHGIRPVFLALPRRQGPREQSFTSEYPELLRAVAAELGVPLLEAPPLTAGTSLGSNEPYFIDTLHLSAAGHERMAEAMRAGLGLTADLPPLPIPAPAVR